MHIRPYRPGDADPLLAIFRKNIPESFGQNEIDAYATFLPVNTDPYFVAEYEGEVAGACGYYLIREGNVARICWILADPYRRGSGVGSALLRHVLNQISTHPAVNLIECETSQVAYRFFEKFDFTLHYAKPDHWAPGLDLYFMSREPKGV
ncbi:GNAT family N-acetyltransferase [Spirosoma utsteinense]|uniref:N-acetylglutamate synthase-like GNAT family acetyltransferase n=1 Tax=Spirosoma utsteinense TaxID=2585773 RepID=A0ABR6W7K8_9BACT|nr:GNAT family N-acetyltransferase [Spirosoma utsteinense]MBC3783920.1 N-acetylglutamate synthase-like GNAT family acetyltransferase [Spirosoma utsteinense]MBC3792554.1 N-acetylglutamate synthase-like GNAT family acetyltransferase [Spirosoma utsteinense]